MPNESWANVYDAADKADKYSKNEDSYVASAHALIEKSGVLSAPSPRIIFDNCCGSGLVGKVLYESGQLGEKDEVLFGDISKGMVASVEERIQTNKWHGATAQIIDAQDAKLESDKYTHVLTNLGIMLLPDPQKALRDIQRILKPGGVSAFLCPNDPGWPSVAKPAFERLPGIPSYPEVRPKTGEWHEPAWVQTHLEELGFVDVRTEFNTFDSSFANAEAFIEMLNNFFPFLCKYVGWTDEEQKEWLPKAYDEMRKILAERFGEKEITLSFKSVIAVSKKAS